MENTSLTSTWLPPFTLHRSQRAKYVRIKISAKNGIQLIVPEHVPTQQAIAFLQKKRSWVEKHLDKITKMPVATLITLPQQLNLLAIHETWQINYITKQAATIRLQAKAFQLTLIGNIDNQALCFKALARWLKKKAFIHFNPWLTSLSNRVGLSYNKLTIRGQVTRWGSCSLQKSISLNYKLLFFSAEIAEYVMIHELSHTKHMNHGKRFWQLVKKFCPNYANHCKFLRNTQQYIPAGL